VEQGVDISLAATGGTVAARWSMAAAGAHHAGFCADLYVATRMDEVIGWGLRHLEAVAFLEAQAAMRERAYAMQFPGAEDIVLLSVDRPVGRLLLHETASACRIVDIALLPEHRGQGLGSWAILWVIERADRAARTVRLQVEPDNRALRLYERLGFRPSARRDGGERSMAMERPHTRTAT
jgi:ribosomal protein S18 acetylase RimI-like enzyme